MTPRKLCLLLLLVTACYADRSVGVSTGGDRDDGPPPKAKFPSKLVGQAGEALSLETPVAGDMDGDGLDDFLLLAYRNASLERGGEYQRPLLYLFYGRAEFPAELSTAEADAAFEVDSGFNGTVGDVNGDGYDDLLLTLSDSTNFIFGSKQRLEGLVPRGEGGVKWTFDALPPPFSNELLIMHSVRGAGDLNGDGCADLILRASALLSADTGENLDRAWVVPGYPGEWKSIAWNGSPLLASVGQVTLPEFFDPTQTVGLLQAESVGDIDGDLRDDLLALGPHGSLMFYGKRDYPAELSEAGADATLRSSVKTIRDDFGRPVSRHRLGDFDGDGRDDLIVTSGGEEFQLAYGQRWSGEADVQAELQISTGAPEKLFIGGAAGDIDGDGSPELMLQIAELGHDQVIASVSSVYVVRGTGKRMRGTIQLSESERWDVRAMQSRAGQAIQQFFLGGDIDGDGSQEILTTYAPVDPFDTSDASIYLVPSTPRAPD